MQVLGHGLGGCAGGGEEESSWFSGESPEQSHPEQSQPRAMRWEQLRPWSAQFESQLPRPVCGQASGGELGDEITPGSRQTNMKSFASTRTAAGTER